MLDSEVGSVLLGLLHGLFKDASWVSEAQLRYAWQLVRILEVRLPGTTVSILVVHLGVHSGLGLILDPLTDEELVLRVVEVTTLALALVANPVTFEVITITFREHTISVALSLVPLALVNVFVRVDHAAFALRQSIHPVTVISVAILVEESASAMLLIFVPVTCVLSAQLSTLVLPVGSLSVALVDSPHTLVLVPILVELDAEAFLAIVTPVADVLLTCLPHLSFNSAILGLILLLDPVNGAMCTILLRFSVIAIKLPKSKTHKDGQLNASKFINVGQTYIFQKCIN